MCFEVIIRVLMMQTTTDVARFYTIILRVCDKAGEVFFLMQFYAVTLVERARVGEKD